MLLDVQQLGARRESTDSASIATGTSISDVLELLVRHTSAAASGWTESRSPRLSPSNLWNPRHILHHRYAPMTYGDSIGSTRTAAKGMSAYRSPMVHEDPLLDIERHRRSMSFGGFSMVRFAGVCRKESVFSNVGVRLLAGLIPSLAIVPIRFTSTGTTGMSQNSGPARVLKCPHSPGQKD